MSSLDREAIMRLLPHRDPFLMVDRVESISETAAVGYKDVRADESWAAGHFPGNPILPGVLMAEALAQLAGIITLNQIPSLVGKPVYLVGIDKIRFRRLVKPGEILRIEVKRTDMRRRMWFFEGEATVDGQRACDGSLLATIPE